MRFAKNSAIQINPIHFPRGPQGRPGKKKYRRLSEQVFEFGRGRPRQPKTWKVDIYSSSGMIDSLIGQGTSETAKAEAQGMIGKKFKGQKVVKVVLDGPFDSIDDISVSDDELDELKRLRDWEETVLPEHELGKYTTDELAVMELAATTPRAPRGSVKWPLREGVGSGAAQPKKKGRPRKQPLQPETHKYKIGKIITFFSGRETYYGIITAHTIDNSYYINYIDSLGNLVHGDKRLHESKISPLKKGRPSEYVDRIISKLKNSFKGNY